MPPRLVVLAPGCPAVSRDVDSPCRVGGGDGDDVLITGLDACAAVVSPAPDGLVVEARTSDVVAAGRPLAPGGRRLLPWGERAAISGCSVWGERPEALDGTRALARAILAGSPAPPTGTWLLVTEGPDSGRRFAIAGGLAVGRGGGSDVRLSDALASRRHLEFEVRSGTTWVRDLHSKNGTWLGGRRLRASPAALASGDVLAFGATRILYGEGPSSPPPPGEPPSSTAPPRRGIGSPTGPRRQATTALACAVLLAIAAALACAAS